MKKFKVWGREAPPLARDLPPPGMPKKGRFLWALMRERWILIIIKYFE